MKIKNFQSKSVSELQKIIKDLRSKINQLFVEKSFNRLKNTNLIKAHKKDLARALTALRKHSIQGQNSKFFNKKNNATTN